MISLVCDIIRNENIPLGIRQNLIPPSKDSHQDEVVYSSDMHADSCGYLDGYDLSDDETDDDDESDEEEEEDSTGKDLHFRHRLISFLLF